MKNKFLLLVAALVLSTTATFASNQTALSNYNIADVNGSRDGEITPADVQVYLESFGIIVCYVGPEQGTSNFLAKDVDGNWYRVYVVNGSFSGWDQVDY